MIDVRCSAIPYYFGKYSEVFEQHLRKEFSAEIIKSSSEMLGSILLTAYKRAPRLLIGADCFTILPVVFAHRDEIDTIYWFDAHGDYDNIVTTTGGFPGGMPFAALTGHACDRLLDHLGADPIDPTKCKHVGGRAWEPEEKETMEAAGVELLESPPLKIAPNSHVHIDVDCFNLEEVPNVEYPERGGLSVESVESFLRRNVDCITSLTMSAWSIETKPPESCVHLIKNYMDLVIKRGGW